MPFKAERILDTRESKVDSIYTEDGKPFALLIHIAEENAKKLGLDVEANVGPTTIGGGAHGEYEGEAKYVTKAFYWPENVPPGRQFSIIPRQVRNVMIHGGTILPQALQYEKVEDEKNIPLSNNATITLNKKGTATFSGRFKILIEIYSPIHAMIVKVNKQVPREQALQMTVGAWVHAQWSDFSNISAIFNQHVHELGDDNLKI